ncbi:asparagine synthase (glutamine-hydrolyzing) [Sulfidibacter corallicola]|uniref:asparagine synthase (glutamine-hydrolyzing) n=1 Tax=Sulfidibacter corallicola TaxID=2818388 RepID=A0A8A4TX71_SULCO|nr:asparagine synthase (glutamine-hydrolyzing) [Sulfidibacter corallicola]QTD53801.1 asparagine synthase (glutamine-hydrolyzing) [Sulfidibacter corallicola]
MCGIAGIYDLRADQLVQNHELTRMIAAMKHRGPDGEGYVQAAPGVGLAHVRLAIIDLVEASNQPFHFHEAGLSMVFNGEIYNYLELREELIALGFQFQTASDTEVLIKGYAAWGDAVVDHLNGMWAFAIYDNRRHRLFCARDRFGIKPFNYTVHQNRLLFGSEIKSILAVAPELARPNWNSLNLVMRKRIGAQTPETCFEGISRLPPAHLLIVEDGEVTIRRYWQYPEEQNHQISYEEAAEELRHRMAQSVRLRMRSDVPVGITLSSGVDSSAVACLASRVHQDLDTFTSMFESQHRSEFPMAKELAESLGLRPNGIKIEGGEVVSRLKLCLHHLESPHAASPILSYWNITEAARRKVKVLLEGQGADELLAGYLTTVIYSRFRDLLGKGKVGAVMKDIRNLRTTAKFEKEIGTNFGPKFYFLMLVRSMMPWSHHLFQVWRGDAGVYQGAWADPPKLPRFETPHPSYDRVNANLRIQMEHLVNLLHYGDAISMAHGLESRLPFLDVNVVEFAFTLPGSFKFRDSLGKKILRDAMRGVVPDEVLDRRYKIGFNSPIADWLRDHAEDIVFPILLDDSSRRMGIFNMERLEKLLRQHVAGEANYSDQIFRWVSMVLWYQAFIERPAPVAACG